MCVTLSRFSRFKVSRGGFFLCFWGNFAAICILFIFLLSLWFRSVIKLCLSNAYLLDIVCRDNQAFRHVQKLFLALLLLIKYLEYLKETNVSNRLLLVLGVKSPRPKSPFLTFLVFTPHVRHFEQVFTFHSFPGRIFSMLLGEFRRYLRFVYLFLLSLWFRSVIMLCLSNAYLLDIVCRNNQAFRHVQKLFFSTFDKIFRISKRNERF